MRILTCKLYITLGLQVSSVCVCAANAKAVVWKPGALRGKYDTDTTPACALCHELTTRPVLNKKLRFSIFLTNFLRGFFAVFETLQEPRDPRAPSPLGKLPNKFLIRYRGCSVNN